MKEKNKARRNPGSQAGKPDVRWRVRIRELNRSPPDAAELRSDG